MRRTSLLFSGAGLKYRVCLLDIKATYKVICKKGPALPKYEKK
jgi:hypothetical protein